MKRRKRLPYWLSGGTETCSLCLQSYVLEMEYRCSGCDRGVCEQCAVAVRERAEVFCGDCPPPDDGRPDSVASSTGRPRAAPSPGSR